MSVRELVVLGTASQVPTRHRNHNGYLLRWDGEGFLFDPGEGTQRQMLRAGVAAHDINRICVTHFHGDHSLGLAGVIQRINLDKVPHPVSAHYPRSGQRFFDRLRHATAYRETVALLEAPVHTDGPLVRTSGYTLEARALPPRGGVRLPAGRTRRAPHAARPARRAWHLGPGRRRLQREGSLNGVALEDVSEIRRGQRFAFVMDTRLCDGVYELAEGADMLVIESTFLEEDEALAVEFGHLTAGQAAGVAREAGVRHLVLTHFSQRYTDASAFEGEARAAGFEGDLTVARIWTGSRSRSGARSCGQSVAGRAVRRASEGRLAAGRIFRGAATPSMRVRVRVVGGWSRSSPRPAGRLRRRLCPSRGLRHLVMPGAGRRWPVAQFPAPLRGVAAVGIRAAGAARVGAAAPSSRPRLTSRTSDAPGALVAAAVSYAPSPAQRPRPA